MEEYNKVGCIQVGNIYPDSENMANRPGGRVYSTMGCSPTILSRDFKQPKMIMEEVKIAAMRGRNPDNPSERGKSNGNYQQRLEINENGTSNTITSVQKDNLVIEPRIIDDTFGFEAEPRMYNDVAPTLRSERSGLKVLEPNYNNEISPICCQSLRIPEATARGYAEATKGFKIMEEEKQNTE